MLSPDRERAGFLRAPISCFHGARSAARQNLKSGFADLFGRLTSELVIGEPFFDSSATEKRYAAADTV